AQSNAVDADARPASMQPQPRLFMEDEPLVFHRVRNDSHGHARVLGRVERARVRDALARLGHRLGLSRGSGCALGHRRRIARALYASHSVTSAPSTMYRTSSMPRARSVAAIAVFTLSCAHAAAFRYAIAAPSKRS